MLAWPFLYTYGISFVRMIGLWYTIGMNIQHDKMQFTQNLIAWYQSHARILPWREHVTPYRVWVSEIMLQQTRVEAVKPYFERFMQQLPTLYDLANADEDLLSKLWEGLGYYHRVRNMKKCAQQCVAHHDATLPQTLEELKALPGIGDYTAGAIASIAYGQCVPAVDGNVLRVFSRVWMCEDDIGKEATKRTFAKRIQSYIPLDCSADFNQALMELGACLCVSNTAPRCNICPVAKQCIGYQQGMAHYLPNKAKKKKRRIENRTMVVVVCEHRVHLHQREPSGLLAGLYEFENLEGKRTKQDILQSFAPYGVKKIIPLPKAKHVFSHLEWHMQGFLLDITKENEKGLWCTWQQMEKSYALPTALKVYRDAALLWMKNIDERC